MAHCIYCGEKNPAGAVFCLACGITLYQEPKPAVANEVKKPIRWLIPVGLTSGLVVLILMVLLWKAFERKSSDSAASRSIIASAAEAVLTIIVYDGAGNQKAQGSGFILATDGLAATNFHVLAGAQRATAECCNGRKFEIDSIEGVNSDEDLVVFQLHETGIDGTLHNLPTVTLDTTGDVSVGEKVIAIGSPQGLENTVSDGIVSAIRSDKSVRYLQITSPISPGSSGGPVLNASGKVIGIATMQMPEGQNLNFAISSEYLQGLLDQHLQYPLARLQPVERAQGGPDRHPASEAVNAEQGEPQSTPLTGQFAGTVHNDTVNTSAGFALFVQDTEGDLSGCMAVLRPLAGSGPITGNAIGPDVNFIVTSEIGKISFTGQRTKSSITGTYLVEQKSGTEQQGTFVLRRTKILDRNSRLDFTNCPTDSDLQ